MDANPIGICNETSPTNVADAGGVNFINGTKVIDNRDRPALKVIRFGRYLRNVTGNINVQNPDGAIMDLAIGSKVNVTVTVTPIP